MREGKEKPNIPEKDYLMAGEEASEMLIKGKSIKENLEAWRKRGYDVKLEPTPIPGLHKITVSDPKTGEVIFYEDEDLMNRIAFKLKEEESGLN